MFETLEEEKQRMVSPTMRKPKLRIGELYCLGKECGISVLD